MRIHRISLFMLVLALSALTCNLPASAVRMPTTPELVTVSSNVPGVQVSIVPVPTSTPIAAKDFAAFNALLADKIAILNLGQLKFIHDMQPLSRNIRPPGLASLRLQAGSALIDQDLKDISSYAIDAAIISDRLGELSARQDNGSQSAAQSADNYAAIARTAYSLVIDVQNLRTALQNNLMPGSAAIEIIAEYGAQLWSASVTTSVTNGNNLGNPFTGLANPTETALALKPNAAAQVQSQINADSSSLWIAQSASQKTKTLNLPVAQMSVSNPADLQTLETLMTREGVIDGDTALQVALENLQRLGATTSSPDPSQPMQLLVPINPIAVAGSEQIKKAIIPSFEQGKATLVSKSNPGDVTAFIQNLGLKGVEAPDDQGKMIVEDEPVLVNLSITNIVIKGVKKLAEPPETYYMADTTVEYSFTVNWSTTVVSPVFEIRCYYVHKSVAGASGSVTFNVTHAIDKYPGLLRQKCWAEFESFRYAYENEGAEVAVLVGDPPGATQRVIRWNTEEAKAVASVTAEAKATREAPLTKAAFNLTSQIVATEVYGTQTAEFKLTAAAAETARAIQTARALPTQTPIQAFSMNGTFSISWSHGYYTTGFIHVTVNPLTGQVTGSIDGSGTYSGDDTCSDGSVKRYTSVRQFSGQLVGSVDLTTGGLFLAPVEGSMSGTVSLSGGCSDAMTMNLAPELALDGTLDLQNHTAKGQIFSTLDYDPGEGDWQAGE